MEHWDLSRIRTPAGTQDPVVLRQDEGGRAILIGLNPGQELGDHQVKEGSWVTVIDGSVRVASNAETVDAGPGHLFRFEPRERHSVASDAGARILLFLAPFPAADHYSGHDTAA